MTHFNESGLPRMVDVSEKPETSRKAIASGKIFMSKETIKLISEGSIKKGDVLSVSQVAGIMAAKKTSDIIPMCHNIVLSGVDMDFKIEADHVSVFATAKTLSQTGVEMEALAAVSVSLLTIYDMCKAVDKSMKITDIELDFKEGGRSGVYKK